MFFLSLIYFAESPKPRRTSTSGWITGKSIWNRRRRPKKLLRLVRPPRRPHPNLQKQQIKKNCRRQPSQQRYLTKKSWPRRLNRSQRQTTRRNNINQKKNQLRRLRQWIRRRKKGMQIEVNVLKQTNNCLSVCVSVCLLSEPGL